MAAWRKSVSPADVLQRLNHGSLGTAQPAKRLVPHRERGLDGLTDLEVDAGADQFHRVAAVVAAGEQRGVREFLASQLDDGAGRAAVVDADNDDLCLARARGELTGLGEHRGANEGDAVGAAEGAGGEVDRHRFDPHEGDQHRDKERPVGEHRAEVQRHADGEEEEAHQSTPLKGSMSLSIWWR